MLSVVEPGDPLYRCLASPCDVESSDQATSNGCLLYMHSLRPLGLLRNNEKCTSHSRRDCHLRMQARACSEQGSDSLDAPANTAPVLGSEEWLPEGWSAYRFVGCYKNIR
jgi:hypothetical protein